MPSNDSTAQVADVRWGTAQRSRRGDTASARWCIFVQLVARRRRPICRPRCSVAAACSISTPIRWGIRCCATRIPRCGRGCGQLAVSTGPSCVVRAIIGQQVSVAGAAKGKYETLVGDGLNRLPATGDHSVRLLFPWRQPSPRSIRRGCRCPRARGRSLVGACAAVADGRVDVDLGADREQLATQLQQATGAGPWTAQLRRHAGTGRPRHVGAPDRPRCASRSCNSLGVDGVTDHRTRPGERFVPGARTLHHLWHSLSPITVTPLRSASMLSTTSIAWPVAGP